MKQNQNTHLSAIIISSVILYVSSSILFCFIGSICGWVGHKHKAMASKNSNNSQPAPLYEDVQPSFPGLAKDQERDFKLKENNNCDMYTAMIELTRTYVADIKPL